MADSGYPKKGEVIHASDVSETFVGVGTSKSISDSWTLHAVNLIRRNDGTVPAIGYVTGSLDESTPGASFDGLILFYHRLLFLKTLRRG